ncbi:pyridoxamine 5'-phosphate oxidase family protein [Allosediminivita pacifica]|uniref:Pyridoxamine 5'-phosphate oxidase N-terminal domain-containing protein n=1 Tax=Allosediminivita pacifica TaxID=1267769 RepID=A0A2T6A4B9_9RHOB|nr:pyridoxamine 5'-phosphate oxidase family protein [Allosediminivita pacifica]PTX38663.1 hypothetical protein C8N44_1421 [Allosediminivita pacifica]GGB28966.1 hypothetical protein GCM10011324_43260 [Allosediminivita pacifica]
MTDRPFYHEDMRALQDRYDGRRVADALEERRLHEALWEDEREMIETSPFFFIATAATPYVDCSIRSGDPGFVKVTGPRTLEWPEYDGNSMYRTLGNIRANPEVGLLFVRFDGQSRRIRISGRASVREDAALREVKGHQGLIVSVDCHEIYPNCPRYLPDLAQGEASPNVPGEGRSPPPPEWKRRDYIREKLPKDDPFKNDV